MFVWGLAHMRQDEYSFTIELQVETHKSNKNIDRKPMISHTSKQNNDKHVVPCSKANTSQRHSRKPSHISKPISSSSAPQMMGSATPALGQAHSKWIQSTRNPHTQVTCAHDADCTTSYPDTQENGTQISLTTVKSVSSSHGKSDPAQTSEWTESKKAQTVFEMAKQCLSRSSHPEELVCRETERTKISQFLDEKIGNKTPGALYISGKPGTGKTATIGNILRSVREKYEKDVRIVEANCMALTDPNTIYPVSRPYLLEGFV